MAKKKIQVDPGNLSNTKQISPALKWQFTLNNYTEDDIEKIQETMKDIGEYVFETEIGENGTPHLQGYIEFIRKKRPCSVFDWQNRMSFQIPVPCGRSEKQIRLDNWKYCTEDYIDFKLGRPVLGNPENVRYWASSWEDTFEPWLKKQLLPKRQLFKITELRPWQKQVYDLIFTTEPDRRSIHWFWEGTGNIGKSVFVNYLYDNHTNEVLIFDKGDYRDLCDAITKTDMSYVKAVIWDMPRKCGGNVSTMTMETILNGRVRSTKYEGAFVRFAPVHIIVFSNFLPNDETDFSEDRWKITEIL